MAHYKFRKNGLTPEISISPLIDMVFLLLIFFIVTSTFKKDSGIKIERPTAKNTMILNSKLKETMLTIDSDNRIFYNDLEIRIDGIGAILEKSRGEQIIIFADKSSDVGVLITVLDLFNELSFENYSIAVDEE